ncbi:hypothetical protein [Lichenifustis flavocetrariae]|uniref:Uncharacterized protein n=1 Tax=Lichenifustis flavocetrariae TaxID=2949735 RepID=A0AA41Z815_9HYPH|nr:hypothetical protein [Lichenifustis flavocetrariae]MCW6510977.1 hypothetical protein [Lichenifustis flavocetrariae]
MKTITSYGGPFIGLNRKDLIRWKGVFGKGSTSPQSPYESDYNTACALTGQDNLSFDHAGYFSNVMSKPIIIAPPVETALITCKADQVIIAQVEAAEADWSFDHITEDVIGDAHFSGSFQIDIDDESADYVFFDSSIDGGNLDEFLLVHFERGRYAGADAIYNHEDRAHINLYMFTRVG